MDMFLLIPESQSNTKTQVNPSGEGFSKVILIGFLSELCMKTTGIVRDLFLAHATSPNR